jgi:hypothetical protein
LLKAVDTVDTTAVDQVDQVAAVDRRTILPLAEDLVQLDKVIEEVMQLPHTHTLKVVAAEAQALKELQALTEEADLEALVKSLQYLARLVRSQPVTAATTAAATTAEQAHPQIQVMAEKHKAPVDPVSRSLCMTLHKRLQEEL